MSALKPGLYRATVRGVPGESIVMVGDDGNSTFSLDSEGNVRRCYVFTDARPLIVLDLEDPAETVRHLRAESSPWDCIEEIAAAIAAQIKPARIPEPGEFGVVEAGLEGHTLRRKFVRVDGVVEGIWIWIDRIGSSSGRFRWDYLIDPTLIRDGVS